MMDIEIEIPAMDIVLADQFLGIGFVHRALQGLALADELAPHINVAGMRAHREAGDQAAFHQRVRIVPHDVAILAGAGFALVGIDHQIMGPLLHFLGHEGPFEAGGETRAAASAQARFFHLVDNRLGATLQDRLGAVPGAALARAFQARIMEAIEIGEDAVAIGKHQVAAPGGFCAGASRSEAALVGALPSASVPALPGPRDWRPIMEPS